MTIDFPTLKAFNAHAAGKKIYVRLPNDLYILVTRKALNAVLRGVGKERLALQVLVFPEQTGYCHISRINL